MKVRYLEHHPDEWLVGIAGLTPEQNGIYRTICDLIASTGGPIPDDDERLFRIIKANRSRINRVIRELEVAGKLERIESKLTQKRVISELKRAENRSKTGRDLVAKRWKIKDLDDTDGNTRARKPRTKNQEPEEEEKSSPIGEPKENRATRLPDDFEIPQDWIADGEEARERHALPVIDLSLEAERFCNYWWAKAGGKDATKKDWHRTWTNWCLNARNSSGANGNGHGELTPANKRFLAGRADTLRAVFERERAAKASNW